MYTYKVMIHPNNKQETKIRRTLNKVIECQIEVFNYLHSFIKNKQRIPNIKDVRKWFTSLKSILDEKRKALRQNMTKRQMRENNLDTLFYDVSNDSLKQGVKDVYNSFVRYFKKESEYPVCKDYKNNRKSFYVDPYKIKFIENKVKLEKIANNQKKNRLVLNWVKLAEKERIPFSDGVKYYNPRVVLDKDRLYIVVSVDDEYRPKKKKAIITKDALGLDMNISNITTSDNTKYDTVTTSKKYNKLEKELNEINRKLSLRYENNKNDKTTLYTRNFYKLKKRKQLLHFKLNCLTESHITDVINDIKFKGYQTVVIEDLNVKEMKEAYRKEKEKELKYLSRYLQKNPFSKFLKTLEYRLTNYGIKVVKANRYFPSSKKCSKCGNIKKTLTLATRVYRCSECGLELDRDYNASINLSNYLK